MGKERAGMVSAMQERAGTGKLRLSGTLKGGGVCR